LKWLGHKGYSIAENFNEYFSSDGLYYTEGRGSDIKRLLEYFNVPMASPTVFSERVSMFLRPKGLKTKGDLMTGSEYYYEGIEEHLTTTTEFKSAAGVLLDQYEEFCRDCGDVVGSDYYNYDYDLCDYCYEDAEVNYCEGCGNDYSYHEFNLEENMCNDCVWEREQEEQDVDNEVDRMREDAAINLMEEVNGKE
jgi:hypothetical protein